MAKYKQTFDNSCGAVALMCAASELGVTDLPRAGKWSFLESGTPLRGNTAEVGTALLEWNGQSFLGGIANGGVTVEKALYAVTSGDLSSYSMPSRVIGCAKQLGLKVSMYANPGFYKSVLGWLYSDQLDACKAQGVTITEGESPGPNGTERELVVFATWLIGLHYVMRRPTPTTSKAYMDPGDGCDYDNFDALNSLKKQYRPTGISLILST
jgi:hypothetical protein